MGNLKLIVLLALVVVGLGSIWALHDMIPPTTTTQGTYIGGDSMQVANGTVYHFNPGGCRYSQGDQVQIVEIANGSWYGGFGCLSS